MEKLISPLLEILHELYIGVEKEHSWVIDAKPGYGFARTVKSLNAEQASTPIVDGGTTVAAHTYHLKWSIDFAMQFYEGKQPAGNWEESWTVVTVTEPEWNVLQQELAEAYEKLKATIAGVKDWSNPMLVQGTIAMLPHAAYHLGSVKQMILVINEKTGL